MTADREVAVAISVVLPTYNGAAHVRESIESVLAQGIDDFELIICDDGSSDETWAIVQTYAGPNCRVLRNQKNRGLFPTLNRLMAEAQSELVHLWSQDDRMLPACLGRTVEFAESHSDVGMIYSRTHFIDENGQRMPDRKLDDPTPAVVEPLLATQIMFYFGSIAGNIANVTLRKSVYNEIGPFREDMKVSGDYEYWVRLSERFKIGYLDERLIEIRDHSAQFSRHPDSGLQFISENKEIHDRLLARLPQNEQARALKFRRWVFQSNAFHFALKSLMRGRLGVSRDALHLLKSETSLLPLAFRWGLSANGRTMARPELIPRRADSSRSGTRPDSGN